MVRLVSRPSISCRSKSWGIPPSTHIFEHMKSLVQIIRLRWYEPANVELTVFKLNSWCLKILFLRSFTSSTSFSPTSWTINCKCIGVVPSRYLLFILKFMHSLLLVNWWLSIRKVQLPCKSIASWIIYQSRNQATYPYDCLILTWIQQINLNNS